MFWPGSQRLGALSPDVAPFPSAAPARAAGRVSGSLQTGPGACFPGGRGGFSGAEFAPCPSPRLFPPWPQRLPPVGSQEAFRKEPGPVCRVGGGGFSVAEFAPFPSPPASYLQRGWAGSSLEFLSPLVL